MSAPYAMKATDLLGSTRWRERRPVGERVQAIAGPEAEAGIAVTAAAKGQRSSSIAKSFMTRTSSPRVLAMRSRNLGEVRNHSAPVRVPRTPS